MSKASFKVNLVILFLGIAFFYCCTTENSTVIIEGNIKNPIGESVQLQSITNRSVNFQWETNIDQNGNFKDTLSLNRRAIIILFTVEKGSNYFLNQEII